MYIIVYTTNKDIKLQLEAIQLLERSAATEVVLKSRLFAVNNAYIGH